MKSLIVEDDFLSSKMLKRMLLNYGDVVEVANDGEIGVEKYIEALNSGEPYDLICLDIMMANVDGFEALESIRDKEDELEIEDPVKIIMTTALDDFQSIKKAYAEQCEDYLIKPLNEEKLAESLKKLGLID